MSWRAAQVRDLWQRAEDTLTVAERDLRDGFPDYGGSEHVPPADAEKAVSDARRFLELVRPLLPLG